MSNKRPDPEMIDDENPEWTAENFAAARPAGEMLSEIFGPRQAQQMLTAKRGRPAVPRPKEQVSLRLDPAIVAAFRAFGSGWQTRINGAFAAWLKEHDPDELKQAGL